LKPWSIFAVGGRKPLVLTRSRAKGIWNNDLWMAALELLRRHGQQPLARPSRPGGRLQPLLISVANSPGGSRRLERASIRTNRCWWTGAFFQRASALRIAWDLLSGAEPAQLAMCFRRGWTWVIRPWWRMGRFAPDKPDPTGLPFARHQPL